MLNLTKMNLDTFFNLFECTRNILCLGSTKIFRQDPEKKRDKALFDARYLLH